jgi:small redox-active disulfide protein 2
MNIKILGSGCAKCRKLEELTREAANELGIAANIIHIKDMSKILEYPILTTPSLVINELVVCSGRVPDKQELIYMINNAKVS